MSDDLVKRLRDECEDANDPIFMTRATLLKAADRIEKLEAALQRANANVEEYERKFYLGTDRIEKLEAELHSCFHRIEELQAALRNIAEGDIPRTVKIAFRDDGQPSKNDRCEHGQSFYEDCGCCIEDYARKALEGKDD